MLIKMLASFWKKLFHPISPEQRNDQGIDLWKSGNLARAADLFRSLTQSYPRYAPAYGNLGMVLFHMHRYDEAIHILKQAATIDPDSSDIQNNLATLYFRGRQIGPAIQQYRISLRQSPDNQQAFGNLLSALMESCQWGELDQQLQTIRHHLRQRDFNWCAERIPPRTALLLPLSPEEQKDIIACYSRNLQERVNPNHLILHGIAFAQNKIRVGYLSADFRNQAVAQLSLRLYGLHDRNRFEVFCYSYGRLDQSEQRKQIMEDADAFIEISDLNFEQAAKRIAQDKIQILTDLTGLTGEGRPEILTFRPAPVQINYLGYSGTTGAQCMDYFVTDQIATPEGYDSHFTERLIRLPGSYMITDNQQAISASRIEKTQLGLSNEALLFCCFNQPSKIDATIFNSWMRILRELPQAVLWLKVDNAWAQDALIREASTQGIDSNRLLFAASVSNKADHLARLATADLYLDAYVHNGHTSACDALWAGVPVLTCPGETFVSRVAASLISATGLGDLVTNSLDEYVAMAIKLGREPNLLQQLKQRLAINRDQCDLFNTEQFVLNLEQAYEKTWARYSHEPPMTMDS